MQFDVASVMDLARPFGTANFRCANLFAEAHCQSAPATILQRLLIDCLKRFGSAQHHTVTSPTPRSPSGVAHLQRRFCVHSRAAGQPWHEAPGRFA